MYWSLHKDVTCVKAPLRWKEIVLLDKFNSFLKFSYARIHFFSETHVTVCSPFHVYYQSIIYALSKNNDGVLHRETSGIANLPILVNSMHIVFEPKRTFYDVPSSHELQAKLCKHAETKIFVTFNCSFALNDH